MLKDDLHQLQIHFYFIHITVYQCCIFPSFQCSLNKFSLPEVSRICIQQLFKICEKYISERDIYSALSDFLLLLPLKVDNTDAEGRLLLADALCYAHNFNARAIVNAATLTGEQCPFLALFEVSFVLLISWAVD